MTLKAFISYSHKDETYFELLVEGLKQHSKESKTFEWDSWDDRRILVGEDWYEAIDNAIDQCNMALLLISANFFASGFIKKNEFEKIIEKAKDQGFLIVPVLINHCDYLKWDSLNRLQFFIAKGKDYGQGKLEKIVYAELVKFDSDGVIIPVSYLEKFHMELVNSIENRIKSRDRKCLRKGGFDPSKPPERTRKYSDRVKGVELEITIDENFDRLTKYEKLDMIKKAGEVLGLNPERFRMRRGSVKLIISLDKRSAEKILTDTDNKVFEKLDVSTVRILSKSGKVLRSRKIKNSGERSAIDVAIGASTTIRNARYSGISETDNPRRRYLKMLEVAIKKKKGL